MTQPPEKSGDTFAFIRRTFVTGFFGFIPLAVTAFIIWRLDAWTREIPYLKYNPIPFVGGLVITLGAIFLTGVIANSLLGRFFLGIVDSILLRLPILGQIYLAWKQVALIPTGSEGTFSRVVMISDEFASIRMIGFTSGRIVQADQPCYCVFMPFSPNPITGRLCFVPIDKCQFLDMTPEDAFKIILSTGNYIRPLEPTPGTEVEKPLSLR
ncbi:MAG: DUF502 domain-containing protein [Tepidisphaeraceae bacterium]|jgi:uncharacterized membrane protein